MDITAFHKKYTTDSLAWWLPKKRCAHYEEVGGKEVYCEANGTQVRYDPGKIEHYLCKKHADEVDKLLENKEAQLRNK